MGSDCRVLLRELWLSRKKERKRTRRVIATGTHKIETSVCV